MAGDPIHWLRAALPRGLQDPELLAAARGLRAKVRLACGVDAVDLEAAGDAVRMAEPGSEPDVVLAADPETWARILAPVPPPGHQTFTALQLANPGATVTGDPLRLAQARPVLERLVECLRGNAVPPPAPRDLGGIRGRYARLAAPDGSYDVFVEEAGQGPPAVFLHTAGADARQYQAILAHPALAAAWRMAAFDLPFHGRSLPPEGWDGGAYALTQARYLAWVVAFLEQVVGEPAVLVGCSMGAAMALVVAAERPDLLRGVVALEPPLRSPGRRNPFLAHAQVSGGLHNAAYVRGLMSPSSPEGLRRRAGWIYAQGGPGVYAGDLGFYSDEFDGAVVAPRIDARRLPVHLLSGEYDYSATPAAGAALHGLMPGSHHHVMPGLGHFPMCENPDLFLQTFAPVMASLQPR